MSRGALMYVVSLESIVTHFYALALFVLYLFIRYHRAPKPVDSDFDDAAGFSEPTASKLVLAKLKRTTSSLSKEGDIDKSLVPRTSSSEEIQLYDDDAIAFLENKSSLELESTPIERRRFLVAEKGNVAATTHRLHFYLQWRNNHLRIKRENNIKIKPTRDPDYVLWVESCLTAMKEKGEVENIVLPRMVRQLCWENSKASTQDEMAMRCRDGKRIFVIRPALMDTRLAKAETYSLAVAIYLDRSFDREREEKVTVCVDVRAGQGWPNVHVLKLIPFIKHSVQLLLPLCPERLHRALVYPVPSAFYYIWTMVAKFMDPLTVDRCCILSGRCKIVAPPPNEKLKKYLDDDVLDELEAIRVNTFR